MSDLTAAVRAARDAFNAVRPSIAIVRDDEDGSISFAKVKVTEALEAAIAAAAPHIRAAALGEAADAIDRSEWGGAGGPSDLVRRLSTSQPKEQP